MSMTMRRMVVLGCLLLLSTAALPTRISSPTPAKLALSPWLVGSAPPPWPVQEQTATEITTLGRLGVSRPMIIIVGAPACAPTRALLGELAQAWTNLRPHADVAVIWSLSRAGEELPTAALPDAVHYRLMADVKGLFFPVVWVLNTDGQVIFDHRGYTSGLPNLLAAAVRTDTP